MKTPATEIRKLNKKVREMDSQLRHWRGNHADVVRKYHKLREMYGNALRRIRALEQKETDRFLDSAS